MFHDDISTAIRQVEERVSRLHTAYLDGLRDLVMRPEAVSVLARTRTITFTTPVTLRVRLESVDPEPEDDVERALVIAKAYLESALQDGLNRGVSYYLRDTDLTSIKETQ
jgi:hypothetical protein